MTNRNTGKLPDFSDDAAQAVANAITIAAQMGHNYIGSEHLLCALARNTQSTAGMLLARNQVQFCSLIMQMKDRIGTADTAQLCEKNFSAEMKKMLINARGYAASQGEGKVGTEHFLLAMLSDRECNACEMLCQQGGEIAARLYNSVCARDYELPELGKSGQTEKVQPDAALKKTEINGKKSPSKSDYPTLTKYGRELTAEAKKGALDPVIGRETEIERLVQILLRRTKNNPCLIGDAGVGKTAIAEGFAQRVAVGSVPPELLEKRVFALDISAMLSGAKYRGDFEERLKGALEEAMSGTDVILFIDEIHMIVGTGAAEGAIDAASILKPLLARGKISLIGATTTDEYRRFIEKDAALERRFQPINVPQPDEAGAVRILCGLKPRLEAHHRALITDDAIKAAVSLSQRYITDRRLPDKAIDLIDEAAAAARVERVSATAKRSLFSPLKERLSGERVVVDSEDVAKAVSVITGIPAAKLSEDESMRLSHLEEFLEKRVIGQEKAISLVANAVRRGRAGLRDPDRPIGSFLFLGQTGVGKTELSVALAEGIYGDEKRLIRFDMSEFTERHSVSKLIGSPPGYVGYDEQGQLIRQVRSQGYSVVLFDEVEKAHPEVLNVLLQILEDGRLTASDGRTADFRNTIVIMTGNIGANELSRSYVGFGSARGEAADVMKTLKKQFRPELLSRIDNVVVFERLNKKNLEKVCRKMLSAVSGRAAQRGIELSFDEITPKQLCESVQAEDAGARPLRHKITCEIEDMLSKHIVSGELSENSRAEVVFEDNAFRLRMLNRQ